MNLLTSTTIVNFTTLTPIGVNFDKEIIKIFGYSQIIDFRWKKSLLTE